MEKILQLTLGTEEDRWGECIKEKLSGVSENGTEVFFEAHNLDDCPEDAVLGRDLFGAADFIEVLRIGMQLGQEGYTNVELI